MLSPTEKQLLKQMKLAVIDRYGTLSAGARAMGASRWQLRRAILGKCPDVLKKMEEEGLSVAPADDVTQAASVAANSLCYYREGDVIAASNARALSGDEWEQITPLGRFPNPAGLQIITRAACQAMVAAFNATKKRLGAAFLGVPIWRGHPDVDPKNYPDDRRYGKVTALDARDDGLWCKPAWNSLGAENREEGFWVYPSGVWKFKRVSGGIEPTELVSVGLTNQPVIGGVRPWAKNSMTAEDLDENPAIRAAQLLYRKTNTRAQNSIVQSTTPGAAKREARKLLKDHAGLRDGFSALTAIANRQAQLQREKNVPERQALLQAQIDLPESAAVAAAHIQNLADVKKTKDRRERVKDFANAARARAARENSSYASAWAKEKRERKKKQQWTPDDD